MKRWNIAEREWPTGAKALNADQWGRLRDWLKESAPFLSGLTVDEILELTSKKHPELTLDGSDRVIELSRCRVRCDRNAVIEGLKLAGMEVIEK